ncbi:MAG TPA: hypothetical protein VEL07_02040 [Planctomycetota bacterium]|nr:hypothetical protein [Planctomycetota bacterium]
MSASEPIRLILAKRHAAAVAAMAEAIGLPIEEFAAGALADWIAKPKNFRRFAKRLRDDGMAGAECRDRVRAVVRWLKRAGEPDEADKAGAAKRKKRRASQARAKAAAQRKRRATKKEAPAPTLVASA